MPLKRRSSSGDGVKFATRKSKGSNEGFGNLEHKYKNTDRADRKVKPGGGKFRRSSDDLRNEEPESGSADRKVKRGIQKLKQSTDGFRNVDYKENRNRKVQSRGNGNDAASYGNVSEKSGKMHDRGQRDSKTKTGVVIDGKYGGKRKRVHADEGVVEDRLYEKKFNRNAVSSPYPNEVKNRMGQNPRDHDTFGKDKSYDGSRTFTRDEFFGRRNARDKLKGGVELKRVRFSRLGNRTMKKSIRSSVLLQTSSDTNRGKFVTDSSERPQRNKFQGKKSFATDSELREDMPKKKKRVIRVDPYDISNKRLDDTITDNGNSKDKKDLAEASEAELSQNAQFRAIIPSTSILSFVDDNLLGRRREIDLKRAGYDIELPAPLDNIPSSTNSERERIEVPVFRNKLEFFAAAKISSSFPPPELPEIAFAGRSNVGKSSLLNALTRQWGVARTSDKPGLTQTINFFKLGPKLSLVDLPGYGFAYAKEEVKDSWEELVKEYVASRASLKRVCLLVDTKWGLKARDYEMIDLMERSQTKYQIVLTKTDLVFPIDVARRAMQIEENLKAKKSAVQPLMMASSRTGAGIRSLRTALANIVRFVK